MYNGKLNGTPALRQAQGSPEQRRGASPGLQGRASILSSCLLYAILDTGYLGGRDPVDVTARMIAGGVDILQVRAKGATAREMADLGRAVLAVTRPAGVPLILNDHPQVAVEIGADGAHVGQDDLAVVEARRILGSGKILGKSTHSLAQALAAQEEAVDYLGVGPIFATPTKPTYTPVGLALVRQVAPVLRIPFFCIGGIKLENASEVLAAGARRLVVVSGILQAADTADYCRRLKRVLEN